VIAINSSYEAVPFADYLIHHDQQWWRAHKDRPALKAFGGKIINVAEIRIADDRRLFIKKRLPEFGLSANPAGVTMKRTTFTGAINLAALLGVTRIVLLGADGKMGAQGRSHHREPHYWWSFKSDRWAAHYKELAGIVEPLRNMGIEVLNASPGSAWNIWPIMTLKDAIDRVN
jgi:sugar phosphate isomerase/epimerase